MTLKKFPYLRSKSCSVPGIPSKSRRLRPYNNCAHPFVSACQIFCRQDFENDALLDIQHKLDNLKLSTKGHAINHLTTTYINIAAQNDHVRCDISAHGRNLTTSGMIRRLCSQRTSSGPSVTVPRIPRCRTSWSTYGIMKRFWKPAPVVDHGTLKLVLEFTGRFYGENSVIPFLYLMVFVSISRSYSMLSNSQCSIYLSRLLRIHKYLLVMSWNVYQMAQEKFHWRILTHSVHTIYILNSLGIPMMQ